MVALYRDCAGRGLQLMRDTRQDQLMKSDAGFALIIAISSTLACPPPVARLSTPPELDTLNTDAYAAVFNEAHWSCPRSVDG